MTERAEKQYIPNALTEAKSAYCDAMRLADALETGKANVPREPINQLIAARLQQAQTAALIAIAEGLQKK